MRSVIKILSCSLVSVCIWSSPSVSQTETPDRAGALRRTAAEQAAGHWVLVHVPHPTTGVPLPALLQVADTTRSDAGFIGMMIRCGGKGKEGELVTLFVVAQPFSPAAHPQVSLQAASRTLVLDAEVAPTGAAIAVPLDIRAQIAGAWRDSAALDVAVKYDDKTLKGVVPLGGLSISLERLDEECHSA